MKRKWASIILLMIFILVIGNSGCQQKDKMSIYVEGLRSLVGETVTSAPLFNGRESRIHLNENTIIDIQLLDVSEENRIVTIIDFAAENRFEKGDIMEIMQEPFFRQVIELEYEMLSETQFQIYDFKVTCVSGNEESEIIEHNIILPEKQIYKIDEPISWKLYVDFISGTYGNFDIMNLDCSIIMNENGWTKYSISRDADDALRWEQWEER